MATGEYKRVDDGPGVRRYVLLLVSVLVLLGGGYAVGRWTAPSRSAPAKPDAAAGGGIRYVDGVPVGFARTARGAGDAAAWYETLIGNLYLMQSRDEARRVLEQIIAAEARPQLVDKLLPSPPDQGNPNISQDSVLRVWAERAADSHELPVGTQVKVKTYSMVLTGGRTDGQVMGPNPGLGGSCFVGPWTMQLDADGRWRIRSYEVGVQVSPPDLTGNKRDGGPRRTDPMAEVMGPDSWVPNMP